MILRYFERDVQRSRWLYRWSDAPPFKAGPIPASEYRNGRWHDAASPIYRGRAYSSPPAYPFRRQRVP